MKKRIFISSVQREFAQVRKQLKTYLSRNPAYRRMFDSFVFEEDVVATDRRTDEVYLDELGKCDLYLGLIGNEYGFQDAEGISPTEREYDEATRLGLPRLMFVLGRDNSSRHPMEFTITIYRPADKSQTNANKQQADNLNDEEIIAFIINNPTLSMQDYANKLQIKYSVLRGRVEKLKSKGLRHEGSRKAGRWIFIQPR